MSTTPTNSISLAQSYLKASLSYSAAFQAWAGVPAEEGSYTPAELAREAEGHIYEIDIPAAAAESQTAAELAAIRPYALIATDTERGQGGRVLSWDRAATGTTEVHGGLLIAFQEEIDPAATENPREIFVQLCNAVGAIISEIMDMAETAGRLAIQHAELKDVGRGKRSEQDAQGDYAEAIVMVEW